MLRPNLVEALKEFLPAELHERAVVAGGFAADSVLANDIDLWVIGGDMERDYQAIREHLINQGKLTFGAHDQMQDGEYERFANEFAVVSEQQISWKEHAGLVASGDSARTYVEPLQILVSSARDMQDLLRRFDITTHQVGWKLTQPGFLIAAPTFTTTVQEPRVTVWSRPEQTMKRLERIAPRYGFSPNVDDMKKLSTLAFDAQLADGFEEAA